jgi:hypothetical protein
MANTRALPIDRKNLFVRQPEAASVSHICLWRNCSQVATTTLDSCARHEAAAAQFASDNKS